MQRKSVYPYKYIDSIERFRKTELPSIEAFYSKLSHEVISIKDYQHAQQVLKSCETLWGYHDVYLKTDVLLLADVLEKAGWVDRVHGRWARVELIKNTEREHVGWDDWIYRKRSGVELIKNAEDMFLEIHVCLCCSQYCMMMMMMCAEMCTVINVPYHMHYIITQLKCWPLQQDVLNKIK